MKDRIRQLMVDKAMSQRTFANELCIAEATLSGIFNGRTRPTNQTITAIHEAFPEVNIQWLMFGEGDMYVNSVKSEIDNASISLPDGDTASASPEQPSSSLGSTFNSSIQQLDLFSDSGTSTPASTSQSHNVHEKNVPEIHYVEKIVDKPQRKITEIRIFFDDGTYETFTK